MSAPKLEPAPLRRSRLNLSLVWWLPFTAAIIGIVLFLRHLQTTGPEVTILFKTAEGLVAGKTEVKYKDVTVGHVTAIKLVPSTSRIAVNVRLDRAATEFADRDARWWVIRPRVGVAGVTGLGTLLSGVYIGVDRGGSGNYESSFIGLETAPLVLRGDTGRTVRLKAADLGSLDIGSPVYFRNMRVGRLVSYQLGPSGAFVDVQIFVDAPYDDLINANTRFWNASGLDLSVGTSGLKINTQSFATVLAGGISFGFADIDGLTSQTIGAPAKAKPVANDAVFELFQDQQSALAPPDGEPLALRMVFEDQVRGLAPGSAVEFVGMPIGTVTATALEYEAGKARFHAVVNATVYPDRLGGARRQLIESLGGETQDRWRRFIERGLRAQMRSANLLTGQMFVALDFHSNVKPVPVTELAAAVGDGASAALTLPTIRSTTHQLEPQIAEIVARLNKVKIDEIGENLGATLTELQSTLKDSRRTMRAAGMALDGASDAARTLTTEANKTLSALQQTLDQARRNLVASDAPVQRNLNDTLSQLQRASQSLRVLSDYLQQHPESLLRGKPADQPLTR